MRETDLYAPVKALFVAQGYEVKGEVGKADLVALRGDEPPVVVELKTSVTLSLFHQAMDRLTLTDHVYIAVPRPKGARARQSLRDTLRLCRRLGVGLITIRSEDARVEVHCDPGPYAPRKNKAGSTKLLKAFQRLRGDPNEGGATRHGLVTAHRQDAVICARVLAQSGAQRGRDVAKATGIAHATRLMRDNHYGWFEKVETGVYGLTEVGRRGLADWADCTADIDPV